MASSTSAAEVEPLDVVWAESIGFGDSSFSNPDPAPSCSWLEIGSREDRPRRQRWSDG